MADQDDQIKDENLDEEVEKQDQSQEDAQDEELQEEESQQEEDEQQLEDEEDDQQEEKQEEPSRREQLRINKLLTKYPEKKQELEAQGIDYSKYITADEEVIEQLGKVSQEYGDSRYQSGLAEADKVRFETRLEIDAPRVESRYPQLDKNSDEFNPAVAHAINNMYLSTVGYDPNTGYVQNPNLRYAEYADAMFELVAEAADRKTETARRDAKRQASRGALRPDGSSSRAPLDLSKDPTQMSDTELDAAMKKMGLNPTR